MNSTALAITLIATQLVGCTYAASLQVHSVGDLDATAKAVIGIIGAVAGAVLGYFQWRTRHELNIHYAKDRERENGKPWQTQMRRFSFNRLFRSDKNRRRCDDGLSTREGDGPQKPDAT